MALVAFSFGAFGDVLALADMVARVAKALTESSGSSHAYQFLVIEMNTLNEALHHLGRLTDSRASRHRSAGAVFSSENLRGFVSACTISVGRIETKILDYQKKLGRGSWGNGWLDSWRKIGWGLFQEEEINKYREEIRGYMGIIHGMLANSSLSILSKLQDVTDGQRLPDHLLAATTAFPTAQSPSSLPIGAMQPPGAQSYNGQSWAPWQPNTGHPGTGGGPRFPTGFMPQGVQPGHFPPVMSDPSDFSPVIPGPGRYPMSMPAPGFPEGRHSPRSANQPWAPITRRQESEPDSPIIPPPPAPVLVIPPSNQGGYGMAPTAYQIPSDSRSSSSSGSSRTHVHYSPPPTTPPRTPPPRSPDVK